MKLKDNDTYSRLPLIINLILILSITMTLVTLVIYHIHRAPWLLSTVITFGTISYHFIIRLLSPVFVSMITHHQYNYNSWWFKPKGFESSFYKHLKVKQWKKKAPTYNPSQFSMDDHSLDEIINNMCHAEIVHEVIILMSFTTLFFSIPFGAFYVFLITAILAALLDLTFVIIQRYNRPRLIKIYERRLRSTKIQRKTDCQL